MSAKKGKRSAIWKMLLAYLAISKIVYYFDMITTTLNQSGLWAVGEAVLERLLTQDILIILIILFTFNTENFVTLRISKYNKTVNSIIVHSIDYVLYIGVLIAYFGAMAFVFGFFPYIITNWRENLIGFSILYFIIVITVEIKKYLKKKEKAEYIPVLSLDEKLAMLKTLLDNGVFTQEEYDSKKEKLLGV
ncbi:MAG: SHOCT domain-containing protein [Oscillospiraceae bacterium]|nr:SHOCT domain-containing protein [Oscillospiraceae bacterium]